MLHSCLCINHISYPLLLWRSQKFFSFLRREFSQWKTSSYLIYYNYIFESENIEQLQEIKRNLRKEDSKVPLTSLVASYVYLSIEKQMCVRSSRLARLQTGRWNRIPWAWFRKKCVWLHLSSYHLLTHRVFNCTSRAK